MPFLIPLEFQPDNNYWIGFEHRLEFEPFLFKPLPESLSEAGPRLLPQVQNPNSDAWYKTDEDVNLEDFDYSGKYRLGSFPRFSQYGMLMFGNSYDKQLREFLRSGTGLSIFQTFKAYFNIVFI